MPRGPLPTILGLVVKTQRQPATKQASDVVGLRLVLLTALGDRYRVRVNDDGSVVGYGDDDYRRFFLPFLAGLKAFLPAGP